MGFFFKTWKEKNIKLILARYPYFDDIYPTIDVNFAQIECEMVMNRIEPSSKKGKACLAYFIGTIDGCLRNVLIWNQISDVEKVQLIVCCYGFYMVKKDCFSSDEEWETGTLNITNFMLTNEFSEFVALGVTSMISTIFPDEPWAEFQCKLQQL